MQAMGHPGHDDDSQEMPTCKDCGQAIFFEHAIDCAAVKRTPVAPIPLNVEQIKAIQDWASNDRMWASRSVTEFNLFTLARIMLKHAKPDQIGDGGSLNGPSRLGASQNTDTGGEIANITRGSIEDIQRRCRATAERFEALAGPAKVDTVVSADALLEAASLLRGYHQSLLLTELDRQKRDGVGVFDRRFDDPF
jgi:hypothetical protein